MKEILVNFQHEQIAMLIPKRRGTGFKRVPLGHHACDLSSLAYVIGYDIFGLDGSLGIQTGWVDLDERERLIDKAVKPIAELLGFPWRVVERTEFWENHPTKHEPDA